MREEIRIIRAITLAQSNVAQDYRRILEPCTYRITTAIRANRFRAEDPFLVSQETRRHETLLHLSDLDTRLEETSDHVTSMLEIQQENNGMAIIAFTIVTIVFLPLSWATSYLGMNTTDIRNLEQKQWLFWAIALPVTLFVICLALMVVLKGETIREFLIEWGEKKVKRSIEKKARLARRSSTWPSEVLFGDGKNNNQRGFHKKGPAEARDGGKVDWEV